MQKIIINHFGPIKHCELTIDDFIVCTGPQASGKSTVAKSVFFFKNLRNILFAQFKRTFLFMENSGDHESFLPLKNRFYKEIRLNFLQIFGSTWCMDPRMSMEYYYAPDTYIKISLKEGTGSPNYIWIECSKDIDSFLRYKDRQQNRVAEHSETENIILKKELGELFHSYAEIVYIPAGRSMITLLSSQLNYVYSFMDDNQKRSIDYCTQNYLERILQLKPSFSQSPSQMINDARLWSDVKPDTALFDEMAELEREILQGDYLNRDGEERLQVAEDRYIKINFASSGQQEVVWILNVLFYYLVNNKETFFIIEEPESHLFPAAQKLITEYIALARGRGKNQIFITTHSPYILGTVNNLLYADKIADVVDKTLLNQIIPESRWLSFNSFAAYFIQNGEVESCVDEEFPEIKNEVIDGASEEINTDFEKMVCLKERYEEG